MKNKAPAGRHRKPRTPRPPAMNGGARELGRYLLAWSARVVAEVLLDAIKHLLESWGAFAVTVDP